MPADNALKAFIKRLADRRAAIAAGALIGGVLVGEAGVVAKTEAPTRDIASGAIAGAVGLNMALPLIDKGIITAKDKLARYGLISLSGLGALGLAHIYAKQSGTGVIQRPQETQADAMVGVLGELKKMNYRQGAKDAPPPLPFSGHTF